MTLSSQPANNLCCWYASHKAERHANNGVNTKHFIDIDGLRLVKD